jgi:hypothetical protein
MANLSDYFSRSERLQRRASRLGQLSRIADSFAHGPLIA